jgi:uncharacterized protein YbaP (TraB family)
MRLILALSLLIAAIPATAKPALWKVSDADTTIWLFGTIHLLDADRSWYDGKVRDAFAKADALVIETITPAPDAAAAIVIPRATDSAGRSLRSRLAAPLVARYEARMAAVGLPVDAFDRFEPWFAAFNLSVFEYRRRGLARESGVEAVLTADAQAAGKPVDGLEGFDEQVAMLDGLDDALQLRLLEATIDDLDAAQDAVTAIVLAWRSGDATKIATLMNDSLADVPGLRAPLLDARNARWADWIARRMAQPGRVFIAVGAGHLGGAASVQADLAARGYKVRRVQ